MNTDIRTSLVLPRPLYAKLRAAARNHFPRLTPSEYIAEWLERLRAPEEKSPAQKLRKRTAA